MNNSILNEGYNSKGPKFIKAKGSYVFDGKKLIDLSFCAGSIILGHNHYVFKNAIKNYLKRIFLILLHLIYTLRIMLKY